MKCMKHGQYALIVSLLVLSVPVAFCQDDVMVLNHQELGAHERSLVKFNHEQHAGKIECVRCHHDYDEYLNSRGGEDKAQPCANCHKPNSTKRTPSLLDAFHAQCKDCHAKTRAKGKTTGPIMCGDCHVKG